MEKTKAEMQEIAKKVDKFVDGLVVKHGPELNPELVIFTRVLGDLIMKGVKRDELHQIVDQHASIMERKLKVIMQ